MLHNHVQYSTVTALAKLVDCLFHGKKKTYSIQVDKYQPQTLSVLDHIPGNHIAIGGEPHTIIMCSISIVLTFRMVR